MASVWPTEGRPMGDRYWTCKRQLVWPPLHLMITRDPLPGVPGATFTCTLNCELGPTVPVVGDTVTPVFRALQVTRNDVAVPPELCTTITLLLGLARLWGGQLTATLAGLAGGGVVGTTGALVLGTVLT